MYVVADPLNLVSPVLSRLTSEVEGFDGCNKKEVRTATRLYITMGQSLSKRIEETLSTSSPFQAAVHASFEECMILSQHSFPGLQLYQLLDASNRIYDKIVIDEDDVISRYKERWLPQPPSQLQVDTTVKKERFYRGGQQSLSIDEFRIFSIVLFRDMGLTTARHRLALYVPLGSLAVLVADLTAKRLPVIGPMYRAGGPLMPGLLLGSVIGGVVVSTQLNLS
jgi:hypothetical protein